MQIKEIKVKDFIIEVDVNNDAPGNYDIHVYKSNGHNYINCNLLYTIPNINVRIVDSVINYIKEWLINVNADHSLKSNRKMFKNQANYIKSNYNTKINSNLAVSKDGVILEYDEVLKVINTYVDDVKLFSVNDKMY